MRSIRVLLADDHALVRAGICALLQKIEGVEVIAEAGDGHEALRLIAELRPDIVLMDIAMPELNGLEAAVRVTKMYPHVSVIMLSMHANEEYVLRALRSGAVGYLLKGARITELELAMHAVAQGETYLSPQAAKHLAENYRRRAASPTRCNAAESGVYERLTPRQREILQLIAEGHTGKSIAQRLNISVKTAEMHRAQLMERLDIHDIAGLVRYAIRIGLVTPDK